MLHGGGLVLHLCDAYSDLRLYVGGCVFGLKYLITMQWKQSYFFQHYGQTFCNLCFCVKVVHNNNIT